MKTMTVGQFRAHFYEVPDAVRAGETVVVACGRSRKRGAAMVPYATLERGRKGPFGLLKDRAAARYASDFALADETPPSS